MIDASTFAQNFGAFWRVAAPTSELVTRRINLSLDRFALPLADSALGSRAALVAETAFEWFADLVKERTGAGDADVRAAFERAYNKIIHLPSRESDGTPLSASEHGVATELYSRFSRFFSGRGNLNIKPTFIGCGFIDTSEGDILAGDTLFEVKSVDRGIRSADIFQLITYYSLSMANGSAPFSKIGIINARRGVVFESEIDLVCRAIGGISAQNIAHEVVRQISSGELSR